MRSPALAIKVGSAWASVVNKVGHRQGPAADHRHFPAQLGHTVGDLRQLWSDRVSQHHLGAGFFGLEQLGSHVNVFYVEFFDSNGLDAFKLKGFL